ncbi:Coenzyme Q-binding protein coq10a, mitochondrial, partial [Coemansia aciculifera]
MAGSASFLSRSLARAKTNSCSMRRSFFSLGSSPPLKQYRDSLIFPFSREQVFRVVADIDKYHEFVPMCVGSKVLHNTRWHSDDEDAGHQCVHAELVVGYPPFNERYTSTVELDHPRRIVATAAPGGSMFKHMKTVWEFTEQRAIQGDAP